MILFKSKSHRGYLQMIVSHAVPHNSSDSSRVTLAYFALSGLDILNKLDIINDRKELFIKWFYHLMCTEENVAGFQNFAAFNNVLQYKCGHIAATYSALNALILLGDDLSLVDKKSLLQSMKLLQLDDGSFYGVNAGTENDMRFVYCAASICYILDDWSGMDVEKAVQYVLNSISYDGGIGQGPHLEAHGGSSYCAIATLALTNQLHKLTTHQRKMLIRWLLQLQVDGFRGRPNKIVDTCYTFWVGASLKILDAHTLINEELLQNFVLATQDFRTGGFSKCVDYKADPLHTYLGLAGLSLMKYDELNEVVPKLNITYRAYKHLKSLHATWRAREEHV